jgi:hypothetical protein
MSDRDPTVTYIHCITKCVTPLLKGHLFPRNYISYSIATCYALYGPGIESPWGEIFRNRPDRPWNPPSLLYNAYRVFLSRTKRPGRGTGHLPPSGAEVGERIELYFYSIFGTFWPAHGRNLPFPQSVKIQFGFWKLRRSAYVACGNVCRLLATDHMTLDRFYCVRDIMAYLPILKWTRGGAVGWDIALQGRGFDSLGDH